MNNATLPEALRLCLEDLVADLIHARRQGDLGRMALLCYCDVRHWARRARQVELAQASSQLFTQPVPHDRQSFLQEVDEILEQLKQLSSFHFRGQTQTSP